ncbi:hypothetical protein QKU48_gp0500 [Fadolivirus algeromassiliense]|jgi:hypothetical protein|uniref:Uncharacterized protein n=1 Tax=Fadolivirus FV1/VV64 TaxID=3070911 RepID=A0A7D3R1P1_9VIRU|nr:hypothetical protein QKU48_gp0500 [Fadolivirus algeromassiliense]QKF93958.1 hypothetical protein Fadolivirus_1_500 [Fadolivirus FV1/VV64]
MTSLFSFLGNGLGAMHIYSKIYSLPEFKDFTDYINEGTPLEVTTKFFRNLLAQLLDPMVNELLVSDEFNTIFNNSNLTRQDQCKLFAGKVFNKLYDQYAEGLRNHIHIDKRIALEFIISTFDGIQHLDKAENGTDCYTLLLNYYAEIFAEMARSTFNDVAGEVDEDNMLDYVGTVLGGFNVVYEYDSKHINEELLDDIRDDISDDSDSDSDSTDENDGDNENQIPTDSSKKRGRDDTQPTQPTPPESKPAPHPAQPKNLSLSTSSTEILDDDDLDIVDCEHISKRIRKSE